MERAWKYIILFIVLVLLQCLLFGNIDYFSFISPYVYVLFILALPVGFNRYAILLLSFLLGFTIDMFSNTPGVHMCASVSMAFFRDYWLKFIIPANELGSFEPTMGKLGIANYIRYALVLILFHHLILFFTEAWSFADFFITLAKAVVNTLVTLLLIICFYLVYKK